MQMTPEQLLEEYRDTVMELHLTRRANSQLTHENEQLRAEIKKINGEDAQPAHVHGPDGEHTHDHAHSHAA